MGMDLLEFTLSIEERLEISLETDDWFEFLRDDPTVGQVAAWLERSAIVEPVQRKCPACEYSLQGHAGACTCPECGLAIGDYVYEVVRWALARAAGVKVEKISSDDPFMKFMQ